MIAACEASLRRLNTDYLDLYVCHEPDSFVPVEETLRAYEDLVRQGKVRYSGCSNHSARHMMKAIATSEKHGVSRYICQQANCSLVWRDVEHEIAPLAVRSVLQADDAEPAARRSPQREAPRRGQRAAGAVSALAPAQVRHRAESAAGAVVSCV